MIMIFLRKIFKTNKGLIEADLMQRDMLNSAKIANESIIKLNNILKGSNISLDIYRATKRV